MTNGGSGYTGGLTSGALMVNGTTISGVSSALSNVLPGGSNNSLYLTGYGTGNSGTGLVVIIPAISATAVQIGVAASAFTI
jgi:hypothetical protein